MEAAIINNPSKIGIKTSIEELRAQIFSELEGLTYDELVNYKLLISSLKCEEAQAPSSSHSPINPPVP